jgi:hypothetical protein
MKSLAVLASVASASAQLVAYPNGAVAPVETPAVLAAKAEHFAAKGLAAPLAYAGAYGAYPYAAGYGYAAGAYPYAAGYGYPYAAGFNGLIANPDGTVVPIDEPAVAQAKAEHLATKFGVPAAPIAAVAPAAVAVPAVYAGAYNGAYGYAAGYGYGVAPYAGLVAHPNGAVVPIDEPAVQAAKAEHFAAKGLPVAPIAGYGYGVAPYAGLVAHPNGAVVPAEPADIIAARAEHLALF